MTFAGSGQAGILEEFFQPLFIGEYFLPGESVEFVWKYKPSVGFMDIVIRYHVGHIVLGLEPRGSDANIVRQVAAHLFAQGLNDGSDAVTAIENVVNNEESVLPIGVSNDIFQGVHTYLLFPFVDAVIR